MIEKSNVLVRNVLHLIIGLTPSLAVAQSAPTVTFRSVSECSSFGQNAVNLNITGYTQSGEFLNIFGTGSVGGTCADSAVNTVPEQAALEALRDFVEQLNRRIKVLEGADYELASQLDAKLGLIGRPSAYNWGGGKEWWFQGNKNNLGNSWYYLLPTGEVFAWSGNKLSGAKVGKVSPAYHATPQNLIDGIDLN